MKRIALLVVVAAVAAVGGVYLWQQKHGASVSTVTALLPHNTVALLHLPDCNRIRDDWYTSELYQLYREPAVQDFLRNPSANSAANGQWRASLTDFERLNARDLFLAITSVADDRPNFVAGFRFRGTPDDVERVLAPLRRELLGPAAATHATSEDYRQHKIDIYGNGALTVASTCSGEWFFAADRIDGLKALLDRVDGNATTTKTSPAPATQPLLADNETFRSAVAEMQSDYALLFYLDPKAFRQFLAQWRPNESGLLDSVDAICATSRFDKGKIHDLLFVAMPKREGNAALTRKSTGLGSKDTFLYATSLLNISPGMQLLEPGVTAGFFGGIVRKISDAMARARITMADWQATFGGEASLLAEWPTSAHWPSAVLVFPVRDFERAKSLAAVVARASDEDADWREFDRSGVHYLSAQAPANLFVLRPTIAVSQQVMIVGVDPGSVDLAIQRSVKPSADLVDSAPYQSAASSVATPTSFFAYLDLPLVYARLDATLRPFLAMGAAFLPGLGDHVDLGRMPPADVVARHLSPIVSSQRYTGRGYVTESTGPITLSQSGVALLFLAGTGYHGPAQQFTVPHSTPTPRQTP